MYNNIVNFDNVLIGSTTTTTTSVIIGVSTGGSIFGCIVLCCCFWICYGLFRSKSNRPSSRRVPPPRTVVVSNTTSPRATAPARSNAAVFVAVKEEVFVVKAEEKAYTQAQTYAGEAPPDYNSVVKGNYH